LPLQVVLPLKRTNCKEEENCENIFDHSEVKCKDNLKRKKAFKSMAKEKALFLVIEKRALLYFRKYNYTIPCASIASATFTKPAIFAPFT
jgi:hypothetical protein